MATSIMVNAQSDVERLARRILRDLGHRRRTVLKTVGAASTERAMEGVAEVTGRLTAAALRSRVPPERVRFRVRLRPRRVRHPRDGAVRDGYRIDVYLVDGDAEVDTALRSATFHEGNGFAHVQEEAGVHMDAGAVAAEGGEDVVRRAVMSAWERIREANGDVIALRLAGILDEDTPLLSYEMFLGPVEVQGRRGVRLLVRRTSLSSLGNGEEAGEEDAANVVVSPGVQGVVSDGVPAT